MNPRTRRVRRLRKKARLKGVVWRNPSKRMMRLATAASPNGKTTKPTGIKQRITIEIKKNGSPKPKRTRARKGVSK